ncbi:MAG: penicillin-binding protein activator [Candidatus Zixiibacteriota bacterium]
MACRGLRIIATCLVASIALSSYADRVPNPPEVVSLLDKGLGLLRQGNWSGAAKIFEELAGRYPNSDNLDQFIFYRAKAKYYGGELDEAIAGFTYFLSRFRGSKEAACVQFFLGNAYYRQGQVNQAVQSYLESYRTTDDKQLADLVLRSLQAAFNNADMINLSKADFEIFTSDKKCALANLLADVLVQKAELQLAEKVRSYCNESTWLAEIPKSMSYHTKDEVEIAVILPFTGELHSFAEDIYNGALIASEFYRSETNSNLQLTLYDTKGDPINAAHLIDELSSTSCLAAIGPLSSDEASVASASLSCGTLPLLVPAATEAGFTLLSGTSFQLAQNIELQAVRMAEYAVIHLRADSAAVITSTGANHLRMADAFVERFQQIGGTIVAAEYYSPRDKDFGPYIRDIKSILLGRHRDSLFFVNEDGDTLDFDGLPAHVDCLFLPGSPEQIRLLIPQIHFYNLQGAYLGSDSWGDEAILKLGDDITKEAVFPSPYLMNETGEEYLRFATAYDARFGRQPNRLASLGYDAVRLVTRALQSGADTRQSLSAALKKVQNYEGASGRISFGENRENVEIPLYRIQSGQVVPLVASEDSSFSTEE